MFKNICRSTNLVRQSTQNTGTKGVNSTSAQNLNNSSSLLLAPAQQQGKTSLAARCLLATSATASKTTTPSSLAAIAPNIITLKRSKSLTQFT